MNKAAFCVRSLAIFVGTTQLGSSVTAGGVHLWAEADKITISGPNNPIC